MKKVVCYTDGACSGNPGPGGFGAILIYGSKELEITGAEADTTNNRMELLGPIRALEALKEPCEVTVYSDSSYVVNAFNEGWVYNWERSNWKRGKEEVKNPDLFKRLLELTRVHKVTFVHVKGHADNEYNNRCDKLAVEAREKLVESAGAGKISENVPEHIDRDAEYTGELTETVVQTRTEFKGRVFDVEVRDVKLPDGSLQKREVIRHNGGVAIVAVDAEENLYLVSQYRSGAEQVLDEIPAGKLEKGEKPEPAILRELQEETGFKIAKKDLVLLTEVFVTPGYCMEKLHIYFARLKKPAGKQHRDEGELLKVRKVPYFEFLERCKNGEIRDAKTYIGVLLAQKYMEKAAETAPETAQ